MTTVLIILPAAAALLIWVLPLNRVSAGSLAVLAALAEVGVWIQMLVRFDFGQSGLQFAQQRSWFSDLNVSYHVGVYAFSVWLLGLTVVVMAVCIAYAFWAGRDRPRAYFGLMLFLDAAIYGHKTRTKNVYTAHLRLGWVRPVNSGADIGLLHPRKRFYAGGANSVTICAAPDVRSNCSGGRLSGKSSSTCAVRVASARSIFLPVRRSGSFMSAGATRHG